MYSCGARREAVTTDIKTNPSFVGFGGLLLGGLDVGGNGFPPGPVRLDREEMDWGFGDERMLCVTNVVKNTSSSTNGYAYWV